MPVWSTERSVFESGSKREGNCAGELPIDYGGERVCACWVTADEDVAQLEVIVAEDCGVVEGLKIFCGEGYGVDGGEGGSECDTIGSLGEGR